MKKTIYLFLILVFIILSCTTLKDNKDFKELNKIVLDNDVPVLLLLPENISSPASCVIIIHGFTGKKEEWLEYNGYYSGGSLLSGLLNENIAVLLMDLPYHGERSNYNIRYGDLLRIMEKNPDMFYKKTVSDIREVVNYLETREDINSECIGLLGYSMGGLITYLAINDEPRIKTAVSCVSPVLRHEKDDPNAPYNNINNFADKNVLMLMARNDINYSVEDAEWLYSLLPAKNKDLELYDSGHKLPAKYTKRIINWFRNYLN